MSWITFHIIVLLSWNWNYTKNDLEFNNFGGCCCILINLNEQWSFRIKSGYQIKKTGPQSTRKFNNRLNNMNETETQKKKIHLFFLFDSSFITQYLSPVDNQHTAMLPNQSHDQNCANLICYSPNFCHSFETVMPILIFRHRKMFARLFHLF